MIFLGIWICTVCFYASQNFFCHRDTDLWAHCALSVFIDKIRLQKVLAKDKGTFKSVKEWINKSRNWARGKFGVHERVTEEAYKKISCWRTLASWMLSKRPKCSISRHRHSWSINQLFYNIIKAINAAVILIIVAGALSSTRQCLRDSNFFTSQLYLETERRFIQVAIDNIKKYCKIHDWGAGKLLIHGKILKKKINNNNFAKNDLHTL